ncbi:SH3-like domain-containing protein [Lactobacillus sp. PV012]|uniref:SH3-like domain-containing protein n=1 Tax=Lactobacillus sp. PV012 TaxID=2594494 RepID=UPI00224088E5|nr:SH3-like domain-containing protein [Lactobacillus sp. PV012]QNQ82548.1 hypothetical protein FP433_05580 [Lactobacillus sp. PV012]
MKKLSKLFLTSAVILGIGSIGLAKTSQLTQAQSLVTKQPGTKNYGIYSKINAKGVSHKVASTSQFKVGHYQSNTSKKTRSGRYWYVYVDGHTVGWVNEKFFVRNKISVAKSVSLVKNEYGKFDTIDAINYVTDSHGTVINPTKVHTSARVISSAKAGNTQVNYTYGKAHASVNVVVRNDREEGISSANIVPKAGPKAISIKSGHRSNFNIATKATKLNNNGTKLSTLFFEPSTLSLRGSWLTQVGPIPEGLTVSNGWSTVSMLADSSDQRGHLVAYKNNEMSKFNTQKLTSLSLGSFKKLAANIKVSPYIRLGHAQSLGSTANYIYVIANDNKQSNSENSEEILQIRKSDMQIEKIWSFKIWNGSASGKRYIHNAVMVNDHTMYALFHNGGYHRYEYWKVTRVGDTWTPVEVGATQSDFVNGSPVQGFTYDANKKRFYIAYNDHIFKVKEDGEYLGKSSFNTNREIEGISVSGSKLYVQMAQRSEILSGSIK